MSSIRTLSRPRSTASRTAAQLSAILVSCFFRSRNPSVMTTTVANLAESAKMPFRQFRRRGRAAPVVVVGLSRPCPARSEARYDRVPAGVDSDVGPDPRAARVRLLLPCPVRACADVAGGLDLVRG